MAKYRLLTKDELESLETDFVNYLVLNGITKNMWQALKEDEKEKSEEIVDLFSDVVFEKILRGINYLDLYAPQSIKSFKCDDETIYLIGMDTKDRAYDFSTPEGIARAQDHPPQDLEIYTTSKKYHQDRQAELFRMIESGCVISDGKLYKSLHASIDNK